MQARHSSVVRVLLAHIAHWFVQLVDRCARLLSPASCRHATVCDPAELYIYIYHFSSRVSYTRLLPIVCSLLYCICCLVVVLPARTAGRALFACGCPHASAEALVHGPSWPMMVPPQCSRPRVWAKSHLSNTHDGGHCTMQPQPQVVPCMGGTVHH